MKMMLRFLLLIIGLIWLGVPAWGVESTRTASLKVGIGSGQAGQKVTVPLWLEATPDLRHQAAVFVVDVTFDPSKLTLERVTPGEATTVEGNEIALSEPPVPGPVPGTKVFTLAVADLAIEDPAVFGLNDGALPQAMLTFRINDSAAIGPTSLTLSGLFMVDIQQGEITNVATTPGTVTVDLLPPPPPVVYGDATGDGRFDSLDINETIDWWLAVRERPTAGPRFIAADVDGNGTINTVDINFMIDRWLGRIARFPVES